MGSGNWEKDLIIHFYICFLQSHVLLYVWPLTPLQFKNNLIKCQTHHDCLLKKYRYLTVYGNNFHQRLTTMLFSFFQISRRYEIFHKIYMCVCKWLLKSIMPNVLKLKEFVKFHIKFPIASSFHLAWIYIKSSDFTKIYLTKNNPISYNKKECNM